MADSGSGNFSQLNTIRVRVLAIYSGTLGFIFSAGLLINSWDFTTEGRYRRAAILRADAGKDKAPKTGSESRSYRVNNRVLVLAIYSCTLGFIFSAGLLINSWDFTTEGRCRAAIDLCLVFSVDGKVLLYLFLGERFASARSNKATKTQRPHLLPRRCNCSFRLWRPGRLCIHSAFSLTDRGGGGGFFLLPARWGVPPRTAPRTNPHPFH